MPASPPYHVRANPLGHLGGDWVFVGKQVMSADGTRAENQIWTVPVDGGAAKLAFAYDVSTAGVPEAIFDTAPYLRRQFSPDGRRFVVSVGGELLIVALETGTVTTLGTSGYFPSWSKDGSQIAYLFERPFNGVTVPPDEAIGVVPPSGGPGREVIAVGYWRSAAEWSPDGATLIVAGPDRKIVFVDAQSGRVVRQLADAPGARGFASWRRDSPQIALVTTGCDSDRWRVLILDDANAAAREGADLGTGCDGRRVSDPRWNPARPTELLYVAARSVFDGPEVHLLDAATRTDTRLPISAVEATWTWDGNEILCLFHSMAVPYGGRVFRIARDGISRRELFAAGERESLFSIASLRY